MKKGAILPLLLATAVAVCGCGRAAALSETDTSSDTAKANEEIQSVSAVTTSEMFSDRDMEVGYDEETSARIILSGSSASCDSDAVQISGSTVTVTGEGTYIISGTLDDGMLVVNADDTDKVQLVLDGADISCSTSAAIYVLEADKVFITTASDSENVLSNGGEYVAIDDNNIDAVIFSKTDLTLNGSGTLTVNAQDGHGIVSKDDLALTSGTYEITAASHGLYGKDSVRISNGTYTIVSGKDGIHAENTDDESEGFIYIAGGTFDITAEGDGISASNYVQTDDGSFTIKAGGGAQSASQDTGQEYGWGDSGQDDASEDSASTKGIKSESDLNVSGGSYVIDAADDAFHSNSNLTVSGGTLEIAAGDDGIHADNAVTIVGGSICITQSYEGIEGLSIDINGGDIDLTASDDGLNAAGGNDSSGFDARGYDTFGETDGAYISIAGGTLHVNASGDGIDSNGSVSVTGGETYVSGPTDSANGALDYASEATISGGIFVAAGTSGMAENFSSSSTQGVMMVTVNSGTAGSEITLTDSSGNVLVSWEADKEYNSVIVSCPEITEGSVYTLTTDGTETEITMDSLVYSSGGSMGGGMGMGGNGSMGGGHGGMGGGRR